ncbi:hypothetical protein MASR2M15_04680 [Anaerolineales bacterium]
MKIFLSYPRKDTSKAKQLATALTQGGHTVWIDDQLTTGKTWRNQLETQIKQADAIALALTPNWIDSSYCQWEFITAVENGKKVIPVLLEKTTLPDRISQHQYADLSDGFDDAKVQKLLNDLLTLAQTVEPSDISDMDKDYYAIKIDQNHAGGGHNIKVSGSGNTVAGGNIDQSRQSIRIGGNVSGSLVNIGGKQTFYGDVTITVGAMPAASEDVRQTFKQQIAELTAELEKQSKDQPRDVKEVKMAAEDAISEAEKPQPDKERLQIRGDKLIEAAKNLASVAPIAVKIAKTLMMIG